MGFHGKKLLLNSGNKDFLVASLAFLALTIAFNFPIVANISSSVWQGSDSYIYLWDFWWTKKAITEGKDLFFSDYIYYPYGASLAFQALAFYNSFLSVPMQYFLDIVTIFNLFLLASFFLTAIATYLLALYLTKDTKASFVAAIIFSFSTVRFAHIVHLDILSTQWIVFFVLFALKTLKEPGKKNAAIAGFFLFLSVISHWYAVVFLIIFVGIFFFFFRKEIFSRAGFNENAKKIIVCLLVFLVLFFPIGLPVLSTYFSQGNYAELSLASSAAQSQDALGFLVPAPFHPIFGGFTKGFYEKITSYDGVKLGSPAETTVYIGYAALALAVLGVMKAAKKETRFWLICAIAFLVLSLGPVLHFNGIVRIPMDIGLEKIAKSIEPNFDERGLSFIAGNIGIPLPYIALHYIPGLTIARSAGRFAIMGFLFLSVLSAFGFSYLRKRRKSGLFFAAVVGIILFESLPFGIPIEKVRANDFYKKIAAEPGDFVVVEVPICNSREMCLKPYAQRYQYFQTVHGKRVLSIIVSRSPEKLFDFINKSPELQPILFPESITESSGLSEKFLVENRLKYIIIHKENFNAGELEKLFSLLRKSFEEAHSDNEIIAFRTY